MNGYFFTHDGFAEKFMTDLMFEGKHNKMSQKFIKHCNLVKWVAHLKVGGSPDKDGTFLTNDKGYNVKCFCVVSNKIGLQFSDEDIKLHLTECVLPAFTKICEERKKNLAPKQCPIFMDGASVQIAVTHWNHWLTEPHCKMVHTHFSKLLTKNDKDIKHRTRPVWLAADSEHLYSIWRKNHLEPEIAFNFKLVAAKLATQDKRALNACIANKEKVCCKTRHPG